MNLIEARKQAHDGWVRSPTRTGGDWVQVKERITLGIWEDQMKLALYRPDCYQHPDLTVADLDAEDWEPKPAPPKLFEADVWVLPGTPFSYLVSPDSDENVWVAAGWRKIHVREVT